MIKYNKRIKMIQPTIKKIRNFGTLNRFLNGAKIIRINPAKLLIKNRGYRAIFVQNSFIKCNL